MIETCRIGSAEVAYTDSGPVDGGSERTLLLLHAGVFADWFVPLAAEPALAGHQVIRMVRAGYTDTAAPAGLTAADHAGHAAELLRRLDAGPAHVVAHSAGTVIALQLAVDHPELVRTLLLSEPPLLDSLADPADVGALRAMFGPVFGAVMGAVMRGDLPAAFDAFMAPVCGPGYRQAITDALGAGALEEAERRCGYFFTEEAPALNAWSLGPADAVRLAMPVLLVQGGASAPVVHRLVAHLAGRLPNATTATVDGANHMLPFTDPAELARLILERLPVNAH
jgi:pimeloyl-ACP methyl ester carboxylesterase